VWLPVIGFAVKSAFAFLVLFAVKFSLQPSAFSLWLKSVLLPVIGSVKSAVHSLVLPSTLSVEC
jgi:hypothetical protein